MFQIDSIKLNKKVKRNLILGGTLAVVAGAYIMHRGRMNAIIEMHQAAVQDTMWSSFDEGVRYGITLVKDAAIDGFAKADLDQYAFGAFDKK